MADVPVTWLAIRDDQKAFEDQQLRALRAAFPDLVEASPAQLGIFFHYCKASGLDPFGRQIYMIKRKSRGEIRWTIQTGIDGYRLIARRAVDRAGQPIAYEDFVWYDADGGEHTVWLREEPPAACRAVVWRGDSRFSAVAHWREYAPKVWDYEAQEHKLGGLWPQMPASQLSKVAEALVLRRACPADLSGLHVDEEMHAADAAESRERVEGAVARLRGTAERKADSTQQAASGEATAEDGQSGVVEAEVVDPPATSTTQTGAASRDAIASEETGHAAPLTPLEAARQEVVRTADYLGILFGEVNDICFELNDVSYQDADAQQLNDLARLLARTDEHIGTPRMSARIAEFRRQREEAAEDAEAPKPSRRRTAAKKTVAKKTTPRKATPAKTTAKRRSTSAKTSSRSAK
ncbi:recombinase RecT [Streptomyces sp. NPDC006356]